MAADYLPTKGNANPRPGGSGRGVHRRVVGVVGEVSLLVGRGYLLALAGQQPRGHEARVTIRDLVGGRRTEGRLARRTHGSTSPDGLSQ